LRLASASSTSRTGRPATPTTTWSCTRCYRCACSEPDPQPSGEPRRERARPARLGKAARSRASAPPAAPSP
jgi:hypothetical protein